MSTANEPIEAKKGNSTLVRPKFSPGLLLQDSDLNSAVDYGRTLTQLLFRNLFGCGVICGYEVSGTVDGCNRLQVTVGRGLALDCLGNPIELTVAQTLKVSGKCTPDLPCVLWVVIRGRECNSSPREVSCTPEDSSSSMVCTRICDGYEIGLLTELPECVCGCAPKTNTPPPSKCCSDAPAISAEQREEAERIAQRLRPWDDINKEERQSRIREMQDGARRCDHEHRSGACNCACCCDWVLLAQLICHETDGERAYLADHTVRRFIRPMFSYDYMAYGVKE